MTQGTITLIALGAVVTTLGVQVQEINSLSDKLTRIENKGSSAEAWAAAAVTKFENDFFAKLSSDEARRQAALNFQQAQRNAAINQGLKNLPTGQMDHPPPTWGRD